MDEIDARLLELLQENSQRTHVELAREVGLSSAAVHKRLKNLREDGTIERYTLLLDRHSLGLDLLCFIEVRFKHNMSPTNRDNLSAALARFPEVLECFAVTGDNDAIMKVALRDQDHLKELLQDIAKAQDVIERVRTSLVLEQYKSTTALPVSRRGGARS